MIRINLLPVRASKKREAGKQWIVLFALVLLSTGIGNYIWWHNTELAVAKVKALVAKKTSELQTLNKIIGEVKDIKQEKKAIEQKLAVLQKLKDRRTGPVKVMDEISTIIPAHVYITSWDEHAGSVHIGAAGTTLDDVASFMMKLKESKYFSNVVLKSTHQAGDDKVTFEISAQVNYSA